MKIDWIGVDWGTTHLRAWAMGTGSGGAGSGGAASEADGIGILAEASSDEGMGRLSQDGFEPALLRLIGDWLGAGDSPPPVLACGMVGSRQGWIEAPYRAVPCAPVHPGDLLSVPTRDPRLRVRIVPGLCQPQPADVMRGEEVQIAGALVRLPGFDGVLCLPGTHSKWAQISAGEVVSFQTCMTGEMFALLSQSSVLRHGMAVPAGGATWDEVAFDAGLAEGLARPERLAALMFRLRAEGLLQDLAPMAARARLSGLLIGAELAATRPYWLGTRVGLIGASGLTELYARALAHQGQTAEILPPEACTLAGLALAAGQFAPLTR